jgi:hypothetical protein
MWAARARVIGNPACDRDGRVEILLRAARDALPRRAPGTDRVCTRPLWRSPTTRVGTPCRCATSCGLAPQRNQHAAFAVEGTCHGRSINVLGATATAAVIAGWLPSTSRSAGRTCPHGVR